MKISSPVSSTNKHTHTPTLAHTIIQRNKLKKFNIVETCFMPVYNSWNQAEGMQHGNILVISLANSLKGTYTYFKTNLGRIQLRVYFV